MRPSETISGRAWLGNFHPADQETASILLDQLRVLSLSELRAKLQGFLHGGGSAAPPFPALIVLERSLKHFGLHGPRRQTAVAWEDFKPGAGLTVMPGSDGFVGMVLRDFAPGPGETVSDNGRWITPTAELHDLKAVRCRSIVILTDNIGSGQQAATLAEAIARNRTIRSWRSFGYLRIHIAAVAAQRAGLESLESNRSIDAVHAIEVIPTIWTSFGKREQDPIVELCRTYAFKESDALGYGRSAGLLVTERSAPNNLPMIFTQESAEWQALFARRRVTAEFMSEIGDYRPSESLEALAIRVGRLRLGRNVRMESLRRGSRDLLQVLTLAAHGGGTHPTAAAESMGIDVEMASAYLATLQRWDFVDEAGRISKTGRRELEEYRRGLRRTTAALVGGTDPYYPVGLR